MQKGAMRFGMRAEAPVALAAAGERFGRRHRSICGQDRDSGEIVRAVAVRVGRLVRSLCESELPELKLSLQLELESWVNVYEPRYHQSVARGAPAWAVGSGSPANSSGSLAASH